MKSNNNIMRNIERLGERYCRRYLDPWDKERLQNNWWEALKFFFAHSFMRGRRDKLSNEYYCFTVRTLEAHFSIPSGDLDHSYKRLKEQKEHFGKGCILEFKRSKGIGNSIKHQDFREKVAKANSIVMFLITKKMVNGIESNGQTYDKEIFLGNDEDIMMVLDVLKFVSDNRKKNIYNYLRNVIADSGAESACRELARLRAIGDKISALVVRDIGLLNPEVIKKGGKDYEWAFPIDTWVRQVAKELKLDSKSDRKIRNCFIEKCKRLNIEPLKFTAGLWYLGSHSLKILLEDCLKEIEIESVTPTNGG